MKLNKKRNYLFLKLTYFVYFLFI